MADNVERQKSTRWVKSVPTYGDWGDDEYGYGYEEDEYDTNDDGSYQQQPQPNQKEDHLEIGHSKLPPLPLNLRDEYLSHQQEQQQQHEKSKSPEQEHNVEPDFQHEAAPTKKEEPTNASENDFILSVDRMKEVDSDSSEEDDDEEEKDEVAHTDTGPEVIDDSHLSLQNSEYSLSNKNFSSSQIASGYDSGQRSRSHLDSQSFHFDPSPALPGSNSRAGSKLPLKIDVGQPPKDIAAPPDTPISEYSFQSDYSYLKEPVELSVKGKSGAGHPHSEDETKSSPLHEEESNSSNPPIDQFVLSVDKKGFNQLNGDEDEDDDDDDDDWGYHSQASSNDEMNTSEIEALNINKAPKPATTESFPDQSDVKPETIDNLINDLASGSIGEMDGDSGNQEVSPEEESFSYSTYANILDLNAEDDEELPSPVEPLWVQRQKEAHDQYLSEFSGRKASVRKAPSSGLNDNKDLMRVETGKEIEKQPNESGNYVTPTSAYPDSAVSKEADLYGLTTDSLSKLPEQTSGKRAEDDTNSLEQEYLEDETTPDHLNIAPPQLEPVASTGSLSTGKLSAVDDIRSHKEDIEEDDKNLFMKPRAPNAEGIDKRVSTVSNASFNLGGWAPNTDNFRNQFISENDNESTVNYSPDDFLFTKGETPSSLNEEIHNRSTDSIPETVDVALPSIHEGPDLDEDDDNENRIGKYSGPTNDVQSLTKTIQTSATIDSVFKDHKYTSPLFKEDMSTPSASRENLNQKYTSLLGPESAQVDERQNDESSVGTSVKRLSSLSAGSTELSPGDKNFVPDKYPVSDWKSIVTISQPIDRIAAFKSALIREAEYDTGLQNWLHITLKLAPDTNKNIHIGKIATEAYLNAQHSELRRHGTLLSKVSIVKDTGAHASSFGKKLFSRSKKFIKSSSHGDSK